MNLFHLEDKKIKITPETLLIPHFKILWDRDKSKDKAIAMAELSYIYFMSDYKSFYLAYPESDRTAQIKHDILKDKDYKPDDTVKLAITKYKELQNTPSLRMLIGARHAQEIITEYYNSLKLDGMDAKSVQPISASLEKLGKIAESIDKLEDKLKREVQTEGRSKGGRTINKFEE